MNRALFHAPWLLTAARVFTDGGAPLYAVGGVVRNALMDLPASDVDVCGPLRPEQVSSLCEGTPVHATLRAAHFGTVELHVADEGGRHMAEYTTFRVDSYRCGHQPDAVRFADTPEADALRRDFSVNALYRPLLPDPDAEPAVIDPTGGLMHLRQGVLHTVTADPAQVLKDDGLRILRAARFQAELGLTPTAALLDAAARYAPLLADIAMERLREELTRILLSDLRYPTLTRSEPPIAAGLGTIQRVGAWPYLLGALQPDAAALAAMAWYRAPEGVPAVSGKLALLCCRDAPEALAEQILRLRYSRREVEAAQLCAVAAARVLRGDCTLMDAVRLGLPAIAHAEAALGALKRAGSPCGEPHAHAQALLASLRRAAIPLSLRALAISGADLLPRCRALGVPTQRIGGALDALWQAAVEGRLPNERGALLAAADAVLSGDAPPPCRRHEG